VSATLTLPTSPAGPAPRPTDLGAGTRGAAMVIGTALLVVGATYVALRGNRATANEPDLDDALDGADEATLAGALDAAPAFAQGPTQ